MTVEELERRVKIQDEAIKTLFIANFTTNKLLLKSLGYSNSEVVNMTRANAEKARKRYAEMIKEIEVVIK